MPPEPRSTRNDDRRVLVDRRDRGAPSPSSPSPNADRQVEAAPVPSSAEAPPKPRTDDQSRTSLRHRRQDRQGPLVRRRHGRAGSAAEARHADCVAEDVRKRDVLADLDSLRAETRHQPHRSISSFPPASCSRTKSVRVTLSFEDGEAASSRSRTSISIWGRLRRPVAFGQPQNRPGLRPGSEGWVDAQHAVVGGGRVLRHRLRELARRCPNPVAPATPIAAIRARHRRRAFRAELENAYTQIVSRTAVDPGSCRSDAAIVDVEAAASIPIPDHRTIDSAAPSLHVDMKRQHPEVAAPLRRATGS